MDTNECNGTGRASYTKKERRELVEEYQTSGLTQAAFCREWNLNPKTLARWLRLERRKEVVSFCEVAVAPELPYSWDDLDALAERVVRQHVTVPGVQAKLSLHLNRPGRSRDAHLMLVGLEGAIFLSRRCCNIRRCRNWST